MTKSFETFQAKYAKYQNKLTDIQLEKLKDIFNDLPDNMDYPKIKYYKCDNVHDIVLCLNWKNKHHHLTIDINIDPDGRTGWSYSVNNKTHMGFVWAPDDDIDEIIEYIPCQNKKLIFMDSLKRQREDEFREFYSYAITNIFTDIDKDSDAYKFAQANRPTIQ